jgi:hypothetical protein
LRRIDVKPRTQAEIPIRIVARNARLARARIGRNQYDAELCCDALRAAFDHEGFFGTGETRQVIEHRHRTLARLRRRKHGKTHFCAAFARFVRIEGLHAVEAAVR